MAELTRKNLKEAFAGESKAYQMYSAFAEVAQREGYDNVARMFRAIARSEAIHARNHLENLQGINATAKNLEEAWKGERDEYTSMYPMFMDQAKRDANNEALKSFFWASEAEKVHGDFYHKAIEALKAGNDVELGKMHICEVCGFTVEGEPPEKCPVCGEGREKFVPVGE